jgi:steroid 5-alpha reductase family enzyme
LQKQAWVSIPLAASMILAAHVPAAGLRFQDALALLVMTVGIVGESLADHQLRLFRADPANEGRVCDRELWSLSRHPNYFFEWVIWFGFPIFAFETSFPLGWLAWLAPACMYWLLLYVSGIPPLEEHMLLGRGDAFRAYQRKVSAFFPWPSSRRGERCR